MHKPTQLCRSILLATFALLAISFPVAAQDGRDELYATHARYRLQPGDVFDVQYRYTPEFNQTVTVQPDGFVILQIAGAIHVADLTVDEAQLAVAKRSETRLREPEVALALKDFAKPSFVVAGEVTRPGKFDLRGPTTALAAIAIAGGFTPSSKHSQVLLVRALDAERAEVTRIDLKKVEQQPLLGEEYRLRPGDMLIVPKNAISKMERIVKWTSLGVFWNPMVR